MLDKATSSCDAKTNARIQELVRTKLRDRIVITVEHRLGNLMACDKVAVMHDGRLIEYGSPGALLSTLGSASKRLWESSNGSGRWYTCIFYGPGGYSMGLSIRTT